MTEQRLFRTEAVVLKGFDYGEADRILTLYTPTFGKMRVIAKGVRKTKSRKSGHVDLFMRSRLQLARGRSLAVVTQAETIDTYRGIRDDLWRATYAHYIAELVDAFGSEGMASYPLYALTVSTFLRLASAQRLDLVVRSFELQILAISGVRPQLYRCLGCGEPIRPVENRFSTRSGGILCSACASQDAAAVPISVSALKLMRNLQTNETAVFALDSIEESVAREVERRLQEYIAHQLEARPRSTSFVERLRAEGLVPHP